MIMVIGDRSGLNLSTFSFQLRLPRNTLAVELIFDKNIIIIIFDKNIINCIKLHVIDSLGIYIECKMTEFFEIT